MIVLVSEKNKRFEDEKQAEIELAFCHYPVIVRIDGVDGCTGEEISFDSFDAAREYVLTVVSAAKPAAKL